MTVSATIRTEIWNMTEGDLQVLVDLIKSRRQDLDCTSARRFTVGSRVKFRERQNTIFWTQGTVTRITPNGRVHLTTDSGRKWTLPGQHAEPV